MAVISYDVSDKHGEVKKNMTDAGYFDAWVINGTTYHLPQTTLWAPNATEQQALAAIESAAASAGVALLRAVATPNTPSAAIPGTPVS